MLRFLAHHGTKLEKRLDHIRFHQHVPTDHDVFDHGLAGEKMGALKGTRQTAPGDLIHAQARHVFAGEFDVSLLWAVKPCRDI